MCKCLFAKSFPPPSLPVKVGIFAIAPCKFLAKIWKTPQNLEYEKHRDWCKKNWTGLESTIKMDIFSIFWLPLLLHSHIGTLIFPGAYQNSFLSLRVLRNTLGSIGTPRTQIQRFSKEPLSVKWPLAPKPLKRLLFFIKDGKF